MSKRKRKIKLPVDRDGTPINIGDWMMFVDGPFPVNTLCYMGEELGWYALGNVEGDESDNLSAGKVISP